MRSLRQQHRQLTLTNEKARWRVCMLKLEPLQGAVDVTLENHVKALQKKQQKRSGTWKKKILKEKGILKRKGNSSIH